jgi:hypothetical protein
LKFWVLFEALNGFFFFFFVFSHFVSILDKLIWFAKTVVIEVGLHERLLVFALQSFWYCFEDYE